MKSSERVGIWIGFVVVSTVWGSTWLAIKLGLESVPPLLGAGLRFLVASAILYAILRIRGIRIPFSPDLRRLYVTLVVTSYSVPFAIVYWGQQFIPSGLGSILFAVFPFWVALLSHFMLPEEHLTGYKLAGMTFGFVGLVIIFIQDIHFSESTALLGMLAVVASTVLQAYSLVLIKKYAKPVSPFALNFVGMLWGGMILLLVGLLLESDVGIVWDANAVGSILYLAVVGSVLAFVTYHWLLKRVDAVYLSLVSFVNPITAILLGAVVLDERLERTVFAGATLVFVGIMVANGKQLYARLAGQA